MKKSKTHTARRNKPFLFRRMYRKIRENKIAFAVYSVLAAITLTVVVYSAIVRSWSGCFNGIVALVLFFLPPFLEEKLKIELSTALEIITMLFVFCAQLLGEVGHFYARFAFWDTLLHWTNGFLFAAFGFALADICNRSKRITFRLSPFFLALVACCFSLSVGVVWEFIEYFMDVLTRSDMQKDRIIASIASGALSADGQTPVIIKNITETLITTADGQTYRVEGYLDIGLIDTMKDLMVDFFGALIFSVIGYFEVRFHRRSKLVGALIPTVPLPEGSGDAAEPDFPGSDFSESLSDSAADSPKNPASGSVSTKKSGKNS